MNLIQTQQILKLLNINSIIYHTLEYTHMLTDYKVQSSASTLLSMGVAKDSSLL